MSRSRRGACAVASMIVTAAVSGLALGAERPAALPRVPVAVTPSPVVMDPPQLSARNLAPGDSRSATATIVNPSARRARLGFAVTAVDHRRGADGARLSRRLSLVLARDDHHGSSSLSWRRASDAHRHALGILDPGERRRYRITLSFRRRSATTGGHEDNAYQGAGAELTFKWRLDAVAGTDG